MHSSQSDGNVADASLHWSQDVLQVFSKLTSIPEVLPMFRNVPTITQALLNSVLTWAQQRVATPAGRAFTSYFATLIPPPPPKCPLQPRPAVTNVLPTEEEVFELLLSRRKFVADESGASLLLTAMAQHVLLQFASENDSDLVFDASQIYGSTSKAEFLLRTGVGGKLKMKNGFPVTLCEAPVNMMYPQSGQSLRYFLLTGEPRPSMKKWAMGNPLLAASPLTFAVGILWLREHNRLCDQLIGRHPRWSDQRLFDAARAIVTGKMALITLRELLPRLAGQDSLSYENAFPDVPTDEDDRALPNAANLVTGLLWTWQLPDTLTLGSTDYPLSDILFTDHRPVVDNDLFTTFEAFSSQPAGKAIAHNHVHALKGWTKKLLRQLRREKMASFNEYRKSAGMPPMTSFFELTGNNRTAEVLRALYDHEDALELYPGLVVEKIEGKSVLPPTLLDLLSAWLHTAISWSSIGPPISWDTHPDLFGDLDGLDEVKTATILNLVRDNTRKHDRIALDVPQPQDPSLPKVDPSPSCTLSFDLGRVSISFLCLLTNILNLAYLLRKCFDGIWTSVGKISWMKITPSNIFLEAIHKLTYRTKERDSGGI